MKKKKVAIDIDGVLLETKALLVKLYNERHDTNYTKYHLRDWDFWKCLNCEEEEAWELFDEITDENLWSDVKPVDYHEVEVMHKLRKKYQVDLVTARTQASMPQVEERLMELGVEWDGVKIVDTRNYKAKANYAKEYEFFVDDSPYNVTSVSEAGGTAYLFDQPWNAKVKYNPRVLDWNQVEYAANFGDKLILTAQEMIDQRRNEHTLR